MSRDYNKTVNLPKTDFPMRASLPAREPQMLEEMYALGLYEKMLGKNEGRPIFNLHDGPPFSNGKIHMGTALNKCLKDFITRYKAMSGHNAVYIPGWDNHGMPIESAIIKQEKLRHKEMKASEFRSACKDFAQKYVDIQKEQFMRMACLGDWSNPYLTMNPKFEAEEVKVFGKMYEKGYVYKGKKPVYWCPHDETALAEAEIEYGDDPCRTIYVRFKLKDDKGRLSACEPDKTYFVIWTTTAWTLPGNLAICLGPKLTYIAAKVPTGETYIIAKERAEAFKQACGYEKLETIAELPGSEFEFMLAEHPFLNRDSLVINDEYVSIESGTGCVHIAPGHGHEDYEICRRYEREGVEIGVVVPVDDHGIMTAEAGRYEGLRTDKASEEIIKDLGESGALVAFEDVVHQYPHCWRCKTPILYRATDQWFCSVDAFKDEAIKAAGEVKWIPEWGHERMVSMIKERADWCISRQRKWGLPIPVFYCHDCGEPVCTPETIAKVSEIFGRESSNAWFDREASELLPEGFKCPHCGCDHDFSKESDTLDGWFDSGSTHIASMELDAPGRWPSELYLEGGDQFRGWFQSSLLVGVAMKGKAPYKSCLCHGWTVDGEGKAMHKSLGNGVYPDEIIPKYGAELIRLWAGSTDYRLDVRCSDAIFKQLSEKYLKIRNTARFILGNINDFDPAESFDTAALTELDRWALHRLNELTKRCIDAYEKYEFYNVTNAVHQFCVVDMSNFYLDIIKDRLYCSAPESAVRRAAQFTIYEVLDRMARLLAPILAFTSNEIWQSMPHRAEDDGRHVMLNDIKKPEDAFTLTDAELNDWELLLTLRDDMNKALELARNEKKVGKPLDARITIKLSPEIEPVVNRDLKTLFIVSELIFTDGDFEGVESEKLKGVKIKVEASELPRCPRCWMRTEGIGSDETEPELCARCAETLKSINR